MSFKLPGKLSSKRTSSFQSKKLPVIFLTEESEHSFHRQKSSMPCTAKNSRALSYLDGKNSASTPSKNNFYQKIYETPKARQSEGRSNSINEIKSSYIHDLIDKITSNQPFTSKTSQIQKLEEKHKQEIEILNDQIGKLQKQVKSLKKNLASDKKKEKILEEAQSYSQTFKFLIEAFVKSSKEITDRLCNYISSLTSSSLSPELNSILSCFNEKVETLAPFISQDTIISSQFLICEEGLQYTGRFRSLRDTQNSFEMSANSNVLKEVIALENFSSIHYGELSFKAGDRIQLVKKDDSNWWLGKIGEKIGRIPSQLVMLD